MELAINTVNTTSARFQNQAFSNRVCEVAVSSKPAVCLIKPLLGVLPSLWTGGGGREARRKGGREGEREIARETHWVGASLYLQLQQ